MSFASPSQLSQQIRDLRRQTVADLDECQQFISVESKEDDEMRKKYRNKWTLSPMTEPVRQLESKMAGYKTNLQVRIVVLFPVVSNLWRIG